MTSSSTTSICHQTASCGRSDEAIHLVPDRRSDPEVEHLPVNPRRIRGPFAIGSPIGEFRRCKARAASPHCRCASRDQLAALGGIEPPKSQDRKPWSSDLVTIVPATAGTHRTRRTRVAAALSTPTRRASARPRRQPRARARHATPPGAHRLPPPRARRAHRPAAHLRAACADRAAAEPAPRHLRAEPDPAAAQPAPQQQAQGREPQDHRRARASATGSSPSCASTPSASSSTRVRSAAGTSRPSLRTGRPRRMPAA